MPPIERLTEGERIAVPAHLKDDHGDHFVLRVVGDGMLDECIMDRDYVICRRAETAKDGDICVCLIGDDATLKKVFYEGDMMRLESSRPGHPATLRVPAADVRINAAVVGLMRRYS